jgi:hypothetical protein
MLPIDSGAETGTRRALTHRKIMNLHVQLMTCSGMETWQAGIRHVAT